MNHFLYVTAKMLTRIMRPQENKGRCNLVRRKDSEKMSQGRWDQDEYLEMTYSENEKKQTKIRTLKIGRE